MTHQEILDLWMRYLEGEPLRADEKDILERALRTDESLQREILDDIELHGLLQARVKAGAESESFILAVSNRIKAEREATGFIKKIESRLHESRANRTPEPPQGQSSLQGAGSGKVRPPTRRHHAMYKNPSWGVWALAAAGILGVVTLFVVRSPWEPDPAASQNAAQARARAAREAAAERQAERDRLGREREEARAQAERRRLEAEACLREIEEKRKLLAQAKPEPKEDPQAQEKREKDLSDLKRDQERIEKELRQAAELAKKATSPAPPAVPQEEKPLAPQKDPAPPSQGATQAAIAQIEEVAGEAFRMTKEGDSPLIVGANLFVADGLRTGAGTSRIVLRFPDKTGVELGPNTTLGEIKTDSGKRLALSHGALRAIVSKQPKDQPMIVKTPHGQAKVVGTTLRIVVDRDDKKGTRLEVEEGKVELKNLADKTVLVESGHYAVSAAGVELVAKPFGTNEIVLFPWQAHLVGGEWTLAKDSAAQGGVTLFSRKTSYVITQIGPNSYSYPGVRNRASFASFTFFAEGGKDYWVWLRGKSLPEDLKHDPNHATIAEVAVEIPNGQLNLSKSEITNDPFLTADHARNFTGFYGLPGFGWIGGNGERPEQGRVDEVPLTVRFPRSGMQTLKLHPLNTPAWIDAVWLSATQQARPQAGQTGPAGK